MPARDLLPAEPSPRQPADQSPGRQLEIGRAALNALLAEQRARRDAVLAELLGPAAHPASDEDPAVVSPSHATLIARLVLESDAQLFRDPAGQVQINFAVDTAAGLHRETRPLRSRAARNWIARRFHDQAGGVPAAQSVVEALAVLEGHALHACPQLETHLRVAEHAGRIYLDVGDELWRAIEIDADGWRVITEPPLRFRRPPAMLPLPIPASQRPATNSPHQSPLSPYSSHLSPYSSHLSPYSSHLSPYSSHLSPYSSPLSPHSSPWSLLRSFLNVADEFWPLILGWLVAALRPRGPYPVLCLHGEQGSAKSTTALLLRSLVDPNAAPLRGEPRETRDLMIAANCGHLICLDNLSRLPDWLSNGLCRLSTGGGFATRTLYENDVETVFAACRPSLLVGIDELATRGDLIDRAVVVPLRAIDPSSRRSEEQLQREFAHARVEIFAGLCTALSTALRNLPTTRLARLPRMADFALWATAAEPALGLSPGAFLEAYERNRRTAHELILEEHPLASALRDLVEPGGEYRNTAFWLLLKLRDRSYEHERADRSWPRSPRALSSALRRLTPALREVGIEVEFVRHWDHGRQRVISLRRAPDDISDRAAPGAS